MVSGGSEEGFVELVLSVDKTDLEQQMSSIFGGVSPSGGLGGGKGSTSDAVRPTTGESGGKGVPVNPGAGFVKHLKHLAILVGIPLSLAALIKSSKLLSSSFGALGQIIGAMIDVFLAPFMPKIAEGIAWLAEHGIPAMQRWGELAYEKVAEWLPKAWETLNEWLPKAYDVFFEYLPKIWNALTKTADVTKNIITNSKDIIETTSRTLGISGTDEEQKEAQKTFIKTAWNTLKDPSRGLTNVLGLEEGGKFEKVIDASLRGMGAPPTKRTSYIDMIGDRDNGIPEPPPYTEAPFGQSGHRPFTFEPDVTNEGNTGGRSSNRGRSIVVNIENNLITEDLSKDKLQEVQIESAGSLWDQIQLSDRP